MKSLQDRASDIIDSSWHYSWYWERNDVGLLTDQGWKEAIRDGYQLIYYYKRRIVEIEGILREMEKR